MGTRLGIVILALTGDLAILTGGIGKGRNGDLGIPETEICKENQAVVLAYLIKVGNSGAMT